MAMSDVNNSNDMAIEMLALLGSCSPSVKQVEMMKTILSRVIVVKELLFSAHLSTADCLCLFWVSRGKTTAEIAELMEKTPDAINDHKKEIQEKLSCSTMEQAVFEAMCFGLIPDCLNYEGRSKGTNMQELHKGERHVRSTS